METSFQSALAEAREAMQRRDAARAAAILRELAGSVPPPGFPWLELATAELVLGRGDAAEAAIDRQLEAAIRDVAALLMKGRLREQAGDARAASSFYRAAEAQITFDGHCPPDMVPLRAHAQAYLASSEQDFTAHLLGSLDGTLSPTMREAVELLTGQRQLYLQEPKVFYYPGLPQRRFWEVDEFPWLHDMLAFVPQMQAELAAVIEGGDTGFDPYVRHDPSRPAPANHLLGKADWSAFHFWRDGAVVAENAARCPATMAALERAPLPVIPGRSPNAHWSSLLPGTHIKPHSGMLNTRLICHIPVLTAPDCWLRVGSETRTWEPGVPLVFDDSIEHEAKNDGPQRRVVLLFEIWRPEIGEEDRAAITRLFQAIGSYSSG
ncbi:aspartyl/asparaginyl beta-hydroxylase domain-containing protein [Novosphingobium sp.]|jgi:aspartyl/asparaginyl beta-hydroxylase (cupin superfamily)|uniref:aspartyl/asparaginyl beta-hydroxylase domain-containing protein n=1 Tax=Novosphingobium sp. TaxID=1874826 RepID=UPI0022C3350A|nr:aspartyl/asparaginyl beta-hydroxylase domain-containing protein [Novosphingobium sp.]MCZ8018946.1 aspartyl/asparaginyl beta-hydroxylase domain-containing protein [Novosphingobium sp.]MCZ8034552.1 aspartyl/asparaginyl beta-hydroxylase domain-containing protein [Novosphingobium sp.]MCZ8052100.1 aspartyl/asparaginyl beta-hydroxylase domain-containing protein [Novosphingobium sp.]MCZ8060026.1 aspartyl/asparaginyl beta-hydroxylase domain-containing protein [Novosphingobium sp.]MCZ8230988.1 aspar